MRLELIEKLSALMTAAFGLVAALAWNTAIQKIFTDIFGEQSSAIAMLFYAIIVTVVAVAITMHMSRLADKAKARVQARIDAKEAKKKEAKK